MDIAAINAGINNSANPNNTTICRIFLIFFCRKMIQVHLTRRAQLATIRWEPKKVIRKIGQISACDKNIFERPKPPPKRGRCYICPYKD